MKLVVYGWLAIFPAWAVAQSVSTLMGARQAGMAYASAALSDGWSLFNNVGGMATLTQPVASAAYDLATALPGANRMAFAATLPVKYGVAGVGVFSFGDRVYSESMLTAGFSNTFGLASLGVRINYLQYRAEGFGTKGVFTIGMGGIARFTDQLLFGAYITNLNQPKLSENGQRVPTLLNAAMVFLPTDKVLATIEIQKDIDYQTTWKAALEYRFHTKFAVRTGFALYPNAAFLGFGFEHKRLTLDYAFQYSSTFRFNVQASVHYKLTKP
jgi:hypothetical protein